MIDKRLAENNIEMEAYDVPISPHQQAAAQNANIGTFRLAVEELRNIATVDLTIKATNYFEKLVWICMVLFGLIWVTYVMREQFLDWSENPTILTKSKMKLSDMEFPALTICSEGSTKFAIAEELGNSFAPNEMNTIPDEIIFFREMILDILFHITGGSKYNYLDDCIDARSIGCEV